MSWHGRRRAGEPLTVRVMEASLGWLLDEIEYEVPDQDLTISLSRMPALPPSGSVLRNVRLKDCLWS